jgi:hypothetical protein
VLAALNILVRFGIDCAPEADKNVRAPITQGGGFGQIEDAPVN